MKYKSFSTKDTFQLAQKIGRKLKGGETIGLIGDLGAGKTTFTQGLAKALGIKGRITSPTFVLMRIYKIRRLGQGIKSEIRNLVHIDAYRMKHPGDFTGLGVGEFIGRPDTVVIIEWADKIKKALPKKTMLIKFKYAGPEGRTIDLS